jgi:hypothetical protein
MARCEVLTTERKRSEFKARDVEQDMARLVKGSAEQHRALGDTENAAAALAAVLSYTVSCKWTRQCGHSVPELESIFSARLLRELSRAAQAAGGLQDHSCCSVSCSGGYCESQVLPLG